MTQVLIFGRRRQGKSTLALALALAGSRACVVWDPNAQYLLSDSLSSVRDVQARLEVNNENNVVIVYRPVGDLVQRFGAFSVAMWDPRERMPHFANYSIIIDEASTVQSPSYLHPELERWLRLAPKDIRIIQTTHRPVDTHRLSRSLASDIFLFQNSSGKDLALIEQEWESADLARAVSSLGVYQCAHYWIDRGGVRQWKVWTDPREWHLEIDNGREYREREPAIII